MERPPVSQQQKAPLSLRPQRPRWQSAVLWALFAVFLSLFFKEAAVVVRHFGW